VSRNLLILIFCLVASGSLRAQEKPVALVVFVSGERTLIQNGQHFDVEVSDLLRPGDSLQTGADGKVSVQCSAGVIFQIGPGSLIRIDDLISSPGSDSIILNLTRGYAAAILAKVDGSQSVKIQTPAAVASVRGTEFVVEASEDETNVSVQNGEVQVLDASGATAVARMGRMLRAHRREKLLETALDERRKNRLKMLDEFRSQREQKFAERIERVRKTRERIRNRRQAIRDRIHGESEKR